MWIVASLVAFGAFIYIAPNLLNPPTTTATPTSRPLAFATPSPPATAARTATAPVVAPPPKPAVVEPTVPLPDGAVLYAFLADPTRSGYLKVGEAKPHWGDRNLHAGMFGGEQYSAILFFDAGALPPNSEILSAELEITGLSRDNLGAGGEWRASLVQVKPFGEWTELAPADLTGAPGMSTIGGALTPADLDLQRANVLRFADDQLPALVQATGERTYLIVRLEGPTDTGNNLFTWDGGGLDLTTGAHPVLRIVARPGKFVIVTNTPTAENVVTAAALAVRQTAFATRVGTPTPFPRTYATATPIVLITPQPTSANVETRVAVAQVATAIAITTGTYTPTPENWVLVTATFTPAPTRTPQVIPVSTLYARLTPTVHPTNTPTTLELLQTPVPEFLRGNLLVLTDRFSGNDIVVMQADGTLVQGLTGDTYYKLAAAREPFSPDRRQRVIVAPDASDVLQIWIQDEAAGTRRPITHLARGLAYDPVWSPDGSRIAYVSRETGNDEIFVYDLGTETSHAVTQGGNPFIYKQRPTWSPDSQTLAFKANDGTLNFQIWMVSVDGSNLRNVSQSGSNDFDPVWVK